MHIDLFEPLLLSFRNTMREKANKKEWASCAQHLPDTGQFSLFVSTGPSFSFAGEVANNSVSQQRTVRYFQHSKGH